MTKQEENTLRPSSSKRWLACPGSIYLSEQAGIKKTVDGLRAAAEGSACHQLLEWCITRDHEAHTYLGHPITIHDDGMEFPATFPVDHDMVAAVDMFRNHISCIKARAWNHKEFCELSMKHSLAEGFGGTADYVYISPTCLEGHVCDLKYGTGSITAQSRNGKKNPQLLCYASLVFDKFPELQFLTLTIIQPRRKTKVKILSTSVTRAECEEFMVGVVRVAEAQNVITPDNIIQYLREGDCWFCNGRSICPLLADRVISRDFKVLDK